MIRVAFRGIAREHLIAAAIALLVSAFCLLAISGPAHGADQSSPAKVYSPFDEPKPAIPQEMLSDKKLDRKVKVYVRNMSLKTLLGELSAKSGVKLWAESRIESERPIICFRSRPLRDVLTEISGLYGYTWLVTPIGYELTEDAQHFKLRTTRLRDNQRQADTQMLEFVKAYLAVSPDDERIKGLQYTFSSAYQSLFGQTSAYSRKILAAIGADALARALTDGVSMGFSEAPAELQAALCEYLNAMAQMSRRWRGEDQPAPAPVDPTSMASGRISIRRAESGSSNSSTRFEIAVTAPAGGTNIIQWPYRSLRYEDMAAVAGWSKPQTAPGAQVFETGLTISPPIPKVRLWLTSADIMQAMAEQSGRDVIADSLRQEQQQPLIAGVPIETLIERLCSDQGYACEVDGSTMRFRQVQWYAQSLPEEPPAELIAKCWKNLEKDGKLTNADLVQIAGLSPKQMQWPGFREMPGASNVLRWPDAFRLYVSLTDAKIPAEGIAVAKLSEDQRKMLDSWLTGMGTSVERSQLADAVVVITTERSTGGYGSRSYGPSEYQQISAKAGDKVLFGTPIFLPPALSDDDRKALIETRKADREGDTIKLVK